MKNLFKMGDEVVIVGAAIVPLTAGNHNNWQGLIKVQSLNIPVSGEVVDIDNVNKYISVKHDNDPITADYAFDEVVLATEENLNILNKIFELTKKIR